MSLVRRLGIKRKREKKPSPETEISSPVQDIPVEPADALSDPNSPLMPMGLESVFDATGLSSHSPNAPQDRAGIVPGIGPIPFHSESCSSHHFLFSCYQYWCDQIKEAPRYHRKQWEFVYVLQALWERGLLAPEKRGLGFGVGREPLTAVMAAHGCNVVATDLDAEAQTIADWTETAQHSATLEDLNERGICPNEAFANQVSFQPVNMNNIPSDLQGFDFCWSACCFEHLGSIRAGLAFYENSLKTLKPGGYAVHTTEINLSSNEQTLDNDGTVLFRRRDLEELIANLRAQGHYCEPLLIHHGSQPVDGFVDTPPHRSDPHLRIALAQYVTTSVGIITRKTPD